MLTGRVYLSDLEYYTVRNQAKLHPFVNIFLYLNGFYGTFRENYLITGSASCEYDRACL
jgi:hypothetical protein